MLLVIPFLRVGICRILTGQDDQNYKLTMAAASDAYNFTNTDKKLDRFCSWVHYHLVKPLLEGVELLAFFYQENGLEAESCRSLFCNLWQWHHARSMDLHPQSFSMLVDWCLCDVVTMTEEHAGVEYDIDVDKRSPFRMHVHTLVLWEMPFSSNHCSHPLPQNKCNLLRKSE